MANVSKLSVGGTTYDIKDAGAPRTTSLAAVATSGSYNDLSNKPTSLPASDVSAWAKAASKPSYTASEVGALASSTAYLSDASVSSNTLTITKSSGATVTFQGGGSSTDEKVKSTAIGSTNANYPLLINNGTSATTSTALISTSVYYNPSTTYLTAPKFNAGSARRLKEDVRDAELSALNIINGTKIVTFKLKDDPAKEERIGFIADDADALISTPSHCYMDMYNCIGVLFKAVQELSAEVERLKNNG